MESGPEWWSADEKQCQLQCIPCDTLAHWCCTRLLHTEWCVRGASLTVFTLLYVSLLTFCSITACCVSIASAKIILTLRM